MEKQKRLDLVGLSGTSAGALCAMVAGYALMPKKSRHGSGSVTEAIQKINTFWDSFAASTDAEKMHNAFYVGLLRMQEQEVPVLGINMPSVGINPHGVLDDVALFELEALGARKEYYEYDAMLHAACPEFVDIDWPNVRTRVLLGASEIINGIETVFDSHCNRDPSGKLLDPTINHMWRARRELTLRGVTKVVSLDVTEIGHGRDPWGGYRRGFEGTTKLKLKDYGIPKDLGPASAEVAMTLSVEGIRQVEGIRP
jgi:NTE family protein